MEYQDKEELADLFRGFNYNNTSRHLYDDKNDLPLPLALTDNIPYIVYNEAS